MAFDYKREYREFYLPKDRPEIVDIPRMQFLAVRGEGDPNAGDGAYQSAIGLLYAIAFTVKMSPRAGYSMDGYFDYVVPPLEGLWWTEGAHGVDYAHKEDFQWISMIRLPDFVQKADFDWAVSEATRKKRADFSRVEYRVLQEGLCVQCMHIGSYDDEPATIAKMERFARENGLETDISDARRHHEIYLSDTRKCDPARLRTVIRHPVRRVGEAETRRAGACG